MKKLIFTLAHLLIFTLAFAQAPQSFEYQAVVRDASGNLLVNQVVGIQITLKQGSATGTSVYQETFSATTNLYGLVNLQIGTGSTGDDFTTINWANGSYFIEVALDVSGGTSYAVMGTSQLLSVPYALHAKTVEVNDACSLFNYYYADRDGDSFGDAYNLVFSCSQPTGYVTDNTDCNDNEVTAYPGAIEICGNSIDEDCDGIINNCDVQTRLNNGETPCQIYATGIPLDSLYGKNYAGGLIFYLDTINCNGLVAAPTDQSSGIQWYNGSYILTGANGYVIGTGQANTTAIVLAQGVGNYAAQLCDDLNLNGYSDWFLPSKLELDEMLNNISIHVGVMYWSSSEADANFADLVGPEPYPNKHMLVPVRAVRSFNP